MPHVAKVKLNEISIGMSESDFASKYGAIGKRIKISDENDSLWLLDNGEEKDFITGNPVVGGTYWMNYHMVTVIFENGKVADVKHSFFRGNEKSRMDVDKHVGFYLVYRATSLCDQQYLSKDRARYEHVIASAIKSWAYSEDVFSWIEIMDKKKGGFLSNEARNECDSAIVYLERASIELEERNARANRPQTNTYNNIEVDSTQLPSNNSTSYPTSSTYSSKTYGSGSSAGTSIYSPDECIGAVVNGRCTGTINQNPSNVLRKKCYAAMINGECNGAIGY
jgi:hypothetical protein